MESIMRINSKESNIESLAKLIKNVILIEYKPDEKIMPERKLAARLNNTQSRVHRALKQLEKEEIVYSNVGDGTYLNNPDRKNKIEENIDIDSEIFNDSFCFLSDIKHAPCKKLKINIPIKGSVFQRIFWQKVIDDFTLENPFMNVIVDYDGQDANDSDIDFVSVHSLKYNHSKFQPLDRNVLANYGFNEEELCPDITQTCMIKELLYGLPVLRVGSGVWINREILKNCNIDESDIQKPVDVFRLGNIAERESGGEIIGSNFNGSHWHACTYGFAAVRSGDELATDWNILGKYLTDFKPYIKKEYLKRNTHNCLDLFSKGKMAMYAYYLHNYQILMMKNNKFSLIPYPKQPTGFTPEGMSVGCITKKCRQVDTASILLAFMVSRRAQNLFAEYSYSWLSVRQDVLQQQKEKSPFPAKSVDYDYDPRRYYSFFDDFVFHELGPMIFSESSKYFLGLQDLDTTIKKLKDFAHGK